MRWILDKAEYREKRDWARVCVDIDSGRLPTDKAKLYFCDLEAMTKKFPPLLDDLLARSADQSCAYLVLDPDPEYFWYDRLGGYPLFELSRGDSPDDYSKFLNRPFGANPGDNMVDMWYSYVIFPPSQSWFVHTIRSDRDDTGHLWIPTSWASGLTGKYAFLRDGRANEAGITTRVPQ